MRILLAHKFWRPLGGVEAHLFELRRIFEERGHEVVPFGMREPEVVPEVDQRHFVSPVEFRAPGRGDGLRGLERAVVGRETSRAVMTLLDEHSVDVAYVLHAYHQLGLGLFGALRNRGIPTILSMHDYKLGCPSYRLFSDRDRQACTICFDRPHGYLWGPVWTGCWNGSGAAGGALTLEAVSSRLRRTYRHVDRVVVVNELQAVGAVRMGVDPERITVIPHFIALEPDPPVWRPAGHVLFVGRLVPEKGVDVLLHACARAELAVRVVGDGRERGALEALARDLGLDARFTGALEPSGVTRELSQASVLAVPSIWHEVWGLVANEAINVGVPVVGSAVGGLGPLLADGRGVPVPPGDVDALAVALRAVVGDSQAGRSMAERARHYAATELTEGHFVARLGSVFAGVGAVL